jgi:predicted metal-dependent hydrolase
MLGMGIAAACLGGFWFGAAMTLIVQDGDVSPKEKVAQWRFARKQGNDSVFVRGIREYLRADFHPDHNPIDDLASDYLASAGL